jgi:hypothetical protein
MQTYDTISQATKDLRERGFTEDFNLAENCLICQNRKFNVDDFEIKEVHRFEGASDPADSSVVYAIKSKDGLKGILVNAYGYASDTMSNEIAKKLRIDRT